MRLLDAERDSLRDGMREALNGNDGGSALEIAANLHRYWYSRSAIREGMDWLTRSLKAGPAAPGSTRARALYGAGLLSRQRGAYDDAVRYFSDHLAIQQDLGDDLAIARAYNSLAGALHASGQTAEASALLAESVRAWERAGDDRGLAAALANLGVVACDEGDYSEATVLGTKALEIRLRLRQEEGIAVSYENLATAALRAGDYADALKWFSEAARRYLALDEPDGVATCLEGVAAIWTQDAPDNAIRLYARAAAIRTEIDVPASPIDSAYHENARAGLLAPVVENRRLSAEGVAMTTPEAVALATTAAPRRMPTLSVRERQVHTLLARGDSNKEIAVALGLSPRTVSGHLTNIYRKLGVRGRTEAVARSGNSPVS
jgi:non-specific serine/threonine protein kinase